MKALGSVQNEQVTGVETFDYSSSSHSGLHLNEFSSGDEETGQLISIESFQGMLRAFFHCPLRRSRSLFVMYAMGLGFTFSLDDKVAHH